MDGMATVPGRHGMTTAQALLRLVRFPFDLLFLTWDFLRLSAWGLRALPSLLTGGQTLPFPPRFEGGILEETQDGALWHCPLTAKYGTKSLLRLLFRSLDWHARADGPDVLCWQGSSSLPPTSLGRYLLTGVLLGVLWGVPALLLAWPYRHYVPVRAFLGNRPPQTDAEPAPPLPRDPEMAAQCVSQAAELERAGKTDQARLRFRDAATRDPSVVAAHLGVGRTSLEMGLVDEARQAFSRAVDLDPVDPQASVGLARALHAQGAHRKAIELLQALTQRHPEAAAAYALQATCLLALNDTDAAAAAIEKALALTPADGDAISTAADLELRRGNLDRAEHYYRALVDQNAANLTGRVGLARILRAKGNTREAEALLRALLAEKPDYVPAAEELVEVLMAAERPLDSLSLCSETIAKHPENVRLRERQLGVLAALGRENDLYVAGTKLINDNPGNAVAHVQLAAMFLRKGLPALAIEHCSKALAQQPGQEAAYRLQTAALLQVGDLEQARERLDRLLAAMPQDLDALVKLSECHRRRGETDKAVALLRQAVGYHPGSSIARSQLGQALFLAGDSKSSLAEFREAHRLAPEDPKTLNNLAAVINYTDGDLNEALALAERARALDPRNPQILDTLAWIHARRGEHAQALPISEMAVILQPDLAILRYHYGAILATVGRTDEAKTALKAALAFGADFHGSAEARALLLRLAGGAEARPK